MDPWDWGVDRVVQELCSANRSWEPPTSAPVQFPPPEQLEPLLREHGVDGHTLLTYDRIDLYRDLKITIVKHKSILKHIIESFQFRSKQYRLYQKRDFSEFETEDEHDKGQEKKDGDRKDPHEDPLEAPSTHETTIPETPATKKRRVAPMLISTEIDVNVTRNIPSEADVVMGLRSKSPIHNQRNNNVVDLTYAYLGNDAITRVDIVDVVDDTQLPSKDILQQQQLVFIQDKKVPHGRQLQVNQLLKRWMLRNREPPAPYATKLDMIPGANNPDHDRVLPLYGNSDDEYDSETWAEIETERSEQMGRSGLSSDEVQAMVDESIQKFASDWRERKASKLLYKSNKIWLNARRAGLKMSIDKTRSDLEACESRIAKYCKQIALQHWHKKAELKSSTLVLQQSVEDKEYSSWVLGVITAPREPQKISAPARTSTRIYQRPKLLSVGSDEEEILTSESEHEPDEFVVDDPLPDGISRSGSPMAIIEGDTSALQQESPRETGQGEVPMDFEQTNTIDLTNLEERDTSLPQTPAKSRHVVDLTTPTKGATGTNGSPSEKSNYTPGRLGRPHSEKSPLMMKIDDLEPGENLVAKELAKQDEGYLSYIFSATMGRQSDKAWLKFISQEVRERGIPKSPYDTLAKKHAFAAFTMLRLFETYRDYKVHSISQYKKLNNDDIIEKARIAETQAPILTEYVGFLRRLSDRFDWRMIDIATKSATPDDRKSPSKKKRRKNLVRNRDAESLRENDRVRAAEQERRKEVVRKRIMELEAQGVMVLDQTKMIINESKEDDQGFIYVHPEISPRIKEHQIAGVRFMWNQIVDSRAKQGCLLAHTMGLGKTMQIITLLVAIAQAAGSKDKTISSQIPRGLKESKTLVLCPASLVDNWIDELLFWAPEGHGLGEFFKVDSGKSMSPAQRDANIDTWDERGGVLIIGYNLFKEYVNRDDFREILCGGPNLVVADEAHMMKNPKSQTHVAAANFRTLSRIALTGSPLANNVEEYHSMVNWIAPNYLSDISEFRKFYAGPIKEGLKAESTRSQRRMALKMLRVLKEEVAPKVQRITIAALKGDLPQKQEFLLTVPLTNIQREAYETFIRYQLEHPGASTLASVDTLGILCAHPSILMKKLKKQKEAGKASTALVETLPDELVGSEIMLLRKVENIHAYELSWKTLILISILDECKRLDDSVLIFSQSITTLDYIEFVLRKKRFSYERIDGSIPTTARQAVVKKFNQGKVDVFLISTRAGGVGLNMTSANRVIIFDVRFNPQHEQQAVGRAYRIGQTKPVYVYRLVCGGTSEEKAMNMAVWKMQLASRVVDKKNPIPKAREFGHSFEMPTEPEQQTIDTYIGRDSVLDKVIEAHKPGIRSITMMDTFEEEELEDAVLTAEDRAEADLLITQNKARRLGQPIPPVYSAYSAYSANQAGPSNRANEATLRAPAVHGNAQGDQALRAPPNESFNVSPTMDPLRYDVVSNQPDLLPPIQGTTTHIRRSTQIPGNHFTNWGDQSAFKGELTRLFSMSNVPHDQEQKRSAAHAIAAAVWDRQQPPEQHGQLTWGIIEAASSPRFVEAICLNLLSAAELAEMEPQDITAKRQGWNELTEMEWERQKTAGRESEADTEHLQYALPQMLSTAEGENSSRRKPHRLDDQAALEAVIGNRKAKQYSHTNPRLPSWAINAVTRQGRIPSPSTNSPANSSSSTTHPHPKNPFK
ncbi:P-loop containing nucleoside triphosphate hydrolase protein [Daldinia sp. FL1419]|nr:P-loop containing nucleoside triphosphate hydrolase protein [Daldinia sp. FL1419]